MEDASEEQPFYVNAKQYHRILKRRIARARLDETLKSAPGRKPYLHESRHKHAMRRPRGQGGRFLTAAEIAEMAEKEKAKAEPSSNANLSDSVGDPGSTRRAVEEQQEQMSNSAEQGAEQPSDPSKTEDLPATSESSGEPAPPTSTA